jgi:tartrate dehydratase beta subunit/fumarate hydratase class I family protein
MRVLTVPAATPTPTPSTPTPSVRSNQSTSAAPTTSGKLAHTGTEVLGLLGMASALIAAGVRLVIGRRRDQDQSA